jgi:hypothetical protein
MSHHHLACIVSHGASWEKESYQGIASAMPQLRRNENGFSRCGLHSAVAAAAEASFQFMPTARLKACPDTSP